MTAVEAFNSDTPPVRIIATDVDTRVLETASSGIYEDARVKSLSRERLHRFFMRGTGSRRGCVKVRPELRKLVTFRALNLLDTGWAIHGPLDAILCRNVMIYFDRATQLGILSRMSPLLADDGLLFTGHSENFSHAADLFRLRGKTVYELSANAGKRRE